jgi:fatty acid-binding protein DegV
VRSRQRGVERLIELARGLQASGACAWCVQHARVPEEAHALAQRLQEVFWRPPEFVTEAGPAVGTHSGPGLLGIAGVPVRFLEEG